MKQIRFFIVIIIFLLLTKNVGWAKTITVDGNNSDWENLTLSSSNYAVVVSSEWVWFDANNDERRNDFYAGNSTENASADLTQFRVTCDASNFYFYFQFRRLQYNSAGIVYPLIQVAIRYDEDLSGRSALLPFPATRKKTEVNNKAMWQRLMCIYQSTSTSSTGEVDIYDSSQIKATAAGTDISKYEIHAATDNSTAGTFFIEAKVPFNVGLSGYANDIFYYVLGKSVKFTVAVFWNAGAFGGISGETQLFEQDKSDVIDCVSIVDEPNNNTESDGTTTTGSAGTWESVKTNKLNTYFNVKFDADGNVKDNTFPIISTNTTVDGVVNNLETVITERKPIFYWEFSDPDNDRQLAVQIQVGTDTDWANAEKWDIGPLVTSEKSLTYDGIDLAADTTFYWRIRIMDDGGAWTSDWSPTYSFHTVTQAVPLNATAKADLQIDWNNPFNPDNGQVTKIRYAIYYQDWDARILVYNINGELVRSLADHLTKKDAVYTAIWDGKNEAGEIVAPGIYLVNLKIGANDILKTKRVLVVR